MNNFSQISSQELEQRGMVIARMAESLRTKILKELDELQRYCKEIDGLRDEINKRNPINETQSANSESS